MSSELGAVTEPVTKSSCSDSDGWIEVEPSTGTEVQGVDAEVDRAEKGESCSETVDASCASAAPAQLAPSESSEDNQVYFSAVSIGAQCAPASVQESAVEHVPVDTESAAEEMPDQFLPARKWSQAECHMHDIRYAEKCSATVPKRVACMKYKILVTGQPETGRSLTLKNLFASYVQDPEWSPKDTSGLDMNTFVQEPEKFTTLIQGKEDEAQNLKIDYIIQETPGLKGDADEMANILCEYVKSGQDKFAALESQLGLAREDLQDERVDVVLYFLPTNARISESDMDYKVINALSSYCPVLPVMCKADCLEQEEILKRKDGLEELVKSGLDVFQFPKGIIEAIEDTAHGVSHSDPLFAEPAQKSGNPDFRLPFNIVAGAHVNAEVGQFWFVRNYRWAVCEAYRTSNSDLRLLRQLLLEEGFWAIKEEAEKRYRLHRSVESQEPPVNASTSAEESSGIKGRSTVESLAATDAPDCINTSSDESSILSPAVVTQTIEAGAKSDGLEMTSSKVPNLFAPSLSTRGLGAHSAHGKQICSTSPPPAQNFLSINSEDTELSVPIGAGASALEALHENHSSTSGTLQGAATHPPEPVDPFDESTCVKATVHEITRGMSRNYRLALKLEDTSQVLCLRIGESEGNSIAAALRASSTSRPSAYDATAELLESLGCKVKRVVVTECNNTIFYARVHAVNEAFGKLVDVDARPSDAVNFAMRQSAPIFIHKDVVRQFAKSLV